MFHRRRFLHGLGALGSVAMTGVAPGRLLAATADELIFGTLYGFADLNPLNKLNHSFNYLLFDALTIIDPATQKATPRLAESWSYKEPTVLEFKLRPGVKFSDGTQLTSEDVKFSIDTILGEKLALFATIPTIDRVEAPDASTVRVITKSPDPILDKRLSLVFVVSKAAYAAAGGTKGFGLKPVGSGQYVMTKLEPNISFSAEAAPTPWRGAPKTRKISWKVFTDPNAFMAAAQSGQVDLAQQLPSVALRGIPGYKVQNVSVGSPFIIQFDTKKAPFDDVRVRRAMNMAIDRDAIIRVILNGAGQRMNGQLPGPNCFGHNPNVKDYAFDLDGARALLQQAGLADGFTTELAGQERDRALLEALSGQFAKLKINVKVNNLAYTAWVEGFNRGSTYPMFVKGLDYMPLFDAEQSYQWVRVGQPDRAGWVDAKWDEMLAASRRELDSDKRLVLLQQMAAYLNEAAPFIFLFNLNWPVAVRDGVEGVDLTTGKWIDSGKVTRTI